MSEVSKERNKDYRNKGLMAYKKALEEGKKAGNELKKERQEEIHDKQDME